MILRFTVPGPPVPKARARVVRNKQPLPGQKSARSFTPGKTVDYENQVKLHALAARCRTTNWPWERDGARFTVKIEIYRSRKQGDWDNFAKAITDACNGVTWRDDRQIVGASVTIHECAKGYERAEIEIVDVKP